MKKFLCVVLSAALFALCAAVPSAAADEAPAEPPNTGAPPIIVVSGMNTFPMMLDAGAEGEKQVFPPENLNIFSMVFKILPAAFLSLLTGDWNRLADRAIPIVNDILGPIACDGNGDSVNGITVRKFTRSLAYNDDYKIFEDGGSNEFAITRRAIELYGPERTYYYNYNWRLDPVGHARELRELVITAKAETGSEKVVLVPCSMGGAQVMAYLAEYGGGDIDMLVSMSSVFCGTYIASDVLSMRIAIERGNILRLIYGMDNRFLSCFVKALDKIGIVDGLLKIGQNIISSIKDRVFDECLGDIFATMPGLWALVQPEDYEYAKSLTLDPEKHAVLIDRIDCFYDNVSVKRGEILKAAEAEGMRIAIFSHYGISSPPVFERADAQSDGIVETCFSSGRAVVAPMGEKLPAGYAQQVTGCGHSHLSPDGIIDASTCMFPEYTWFFKNVAHVGAVYGGDQNDCLFKLIEFEGQPTIHSDGLYPQFMEDAGNHKLQVSSGK